MYTRQKPKSEIQAVISSLIGLIVLKSIMIGALFAQVPPNPPGKFGPYIAATITLAAIALTLVHWRNKTGFIVSIVVGVMCLVSMGPQKLFLESSAKLLLPIIILGTVLSLILIIYSGKCLQTNKVQ